MTSREFLNVAHAALVEEFMRPIGPGGIGHSLLDALEMAAPWAEGYKEPDLDFVPAGGNATQESTTPIDQVPTEKEIVAQNQRALAWLEGRMRNMKGGFATT